MKHTVVKFKRVDGKNWIAGNVKEGRYGPQIGMKKSPELQEYLDSVPQGGWINFNLYEPYQEKQSAHDEAKANGYQRQELDDEIPPF